MVLICTVNFTTSQLQEEKKYIIERGVRDMISDEIRKLLYTLLNESLYR